MSTPEKKSEDWYKEFKQLNNTPPAGTPASTAPAEPAPAASNAPGGKAERRHHNRFGVEEAQTALYRHGLLTVFGVGKDNLAKSAVDMSEGGARVLLRERLKPGSRVKLKIEIEKFKDGIEVAAEVRWCFECGTRPGDYYAGLQFVSLDEQQKRKIALMRDWFNSPLAKAGRTTQGRSKPATQVPVRSKPPTHVPQKK